METKKQKTFSLSAIKVDALAEVQVKKESLLATIKDNPFVEITDNASHDAAKKSRTALRTARTDTEKEEKLVLGKIKECITDKVKNHYAGFKEIIRPAEDRQQAEVTRWEDIKEQERQEKARLDEERRQRHINAIEKFYNDTRKVIDNLDYQASVNFDIRHDFEDYSFEEFADQFESKVEMLKIYLTDKKSKLQEEETLRLEREDLNRRMEEIKKKEALKNQIEEWFMRWENVINRFTEIEDLPRITQQFTEEAALSVGEFQPLYAEKRAQLVKMLEAKDEQLKKKEEYNRQQAILEEEKRKLQVQQEAFTKQQRRAQLHSLGFDADSAYSQNGLNIIVSEDNLLTDEAEWQEFVKETALRIENAANPPVKNVADIEVIEPDFAGVQEVTETENQLIPDEALSTQQLQAQQLLFDFEAWLAEEGLSFNKDSINLFVKSIGYAHA